MRYCLFMLCLVAFSFQAAMGTEHSTGTDSASPASKADPNTLEKLLDNIGAAAGDLKTFESDLSYLAIQDPDIVESTSLQTGKLYYQKGDKQSQLRIRFETIQQDDFPAEKSVEDYYFDGVWLTKVDYKLEQVSFYQQAPEDKPVDVFELINQRFPLIGFSGAKTLQEDFDISLVPSKPADPNETIHLLLDVKEDSAYQDDYKKVDFWINKNTYSPVRVRAYSTQGDIYDVRFSAVRINKKLKNGVFDIETPAGFRQNREPLETAH